MLTHTAVLASSVQAIIATDGRCAVFTGARDGTGLELVGADAATPAAGAGVPA